MEDAINAEIDDDDEDVPDDEVWYLSDDEHYEFKAYNDACIELNVPSFVNIDNQIPYPNSGHILGNKRPMMNNEFRQQLVMELFAETTNLNVPRGLMKHLGIKYGVNRTTIHRIWSKAKKQKTEGQDICVNHAKKNCGRKPLLTDEEILCSIPLKQRTTLRSFAAALGVSPSTVYRLLKRGILRSHTNSIKPKLTDKHRTARLQFVVSRVIPGTIHTLPRFKMMYNMVHIDEKWFFMSRITQRFYLLSEEQDPYRAV